MNVLWRNNAIMNKFTTNNLTFNAIIYKKKKRRHQRNPIPKTPPTHKTAIHPRCTFTSTTHKSTRRRTLHPTLNSIHTQSSQLQGPAKSKVSTASIVIITPDCVSTAFRKSPGDSGSVPRSFATELVVPGASPTTGAAARLIGHERSWFESDGWWIIWACESWKDRWMCRLRRGVDLFWGDDGFFGFPGDCLGGEFWFFW